MPLQFKEMPRLFPQQRMWGCATPRYTFIITEEGGKFSASAKLGGKGSRIDLGGGFEAFDSWDAAQQSCVDLLYPTSERS